MKQHKTDIEKFTESSKVAKHVNIEQRAFDFDNTETLSHESNWWRRITSNAT